MAWGRLKTMAKEKARGSVRCEGEMRFYELCGMHGL